MNWFEELAEYKPEPAATGLKTQYIFREFQSNRLDPKKKKGPRLVSLKYYQFMPTDRENTAHANKLMNLVFLSICKAKPA